MRFSLILLAFAGICLGSTARTEQEKTGNSTQGLDKPKYEGYYTLRVYAPDNKQLHGKVINARDKAFIIGAEKPTTFCDLKDKRQCPDGSRTLINDEMTQLASAVPGGQFIYITPHSGSITYPPPHSAFRPPGSLVGGFYPFTVVSNCSDTITVLYYQSKYSKSGLLACLTPIKQSWFDVKEAILKTESGSLIGEECKDVEGIQIVEAGNRFGAWAYT